MRISRLCHSATVLQPTVGQVSDLSYDICAFNTNVAREYYKIANTLKTFPQPMYREAVKQKNRVSCKARFQWE